MPIEVAQFIDAKVVEAGDNDSEEHSKDDYETSQSELSFWRLMHSNSIQILLTMITLMNAIHPIVYMDGMIPIRQMPLHSYKNMSRRNSKKKVAKWAITVNMLHVLTTMN